MASQYGLFANYPLLGSCSLTSANTARDGSGSLNLLYTASVDSLLKQIIFNIASPEASLAPSSKVLRVFISDDVGGIFLYDEILPKYTDQPTTTTRTRPFRLDLDELPLKAGCSIYVTQSVYSSNVDNMTAFVYGYRI